MMTPCEGVLTIVGIVSVGFAAVSLYLMALSIQTENFVGILVYTGGTIAFGIIILLICYILLHLNPKIEKLKQSHSDQPPLQETQNQQESQTQHQTQDHVQIVSSYPDYG